MIGTLNTAQETRTASTRMSLPNLLLRLEGLTFFIGAIALYASQGYSGLAFVLLLLVPDVSMLGYLINTRVGSWTYNAVHNYTLPVLLIALGLVSGVAVGVQVGLIWIAHISMDRILGYGFKYPTAFKDTHLGRV